MARMFEAVACNHLWSAWLELGFFARCVCVCVSVSGGVGGQCIVDGAAVDFAANR